MHTLILKPSTYRLLLTVLFGSTMLLGCASKTPLLDERFGEAVNAAKAQQTINPDASQSASSATGMDGTAANSAVDRYQKSFVQPPVTPNVFNIGVGSGGVGSSTSGNR